MTRASGTRQGRRLQYQFLRYPRTLTMMTVDRDNTGEQGDPKGAATTGKRKEPPHHDEADFDGASAEHYASSNILETSRSERKREKERKRRGDFNRGLDQLMSLVVTIDPELKTEVQDRYRKSHTRVMSQVTPEKMFSRVDLISNTVTTLQRVHQENEERKMVIAHLAKRSLATNGGHGNDPVVPFPTRAQNMQVSQ